MRPLNIYKAVTGVEVIGGRDSKPGRFPKVFAGWPHCKPSLCDWWDPWWCWHWAVIRAEQTEDMPRGNKVNNSPKKNPQQHTNLLQLLSPPRPGHIARRLQFVFVTMGNVKHSSCALLTAFIPRFSPSISLSRWQIKEQISGCAAVTVLKGREARGCRGWPRCLEPQHSPAERSTEEGRAPGSPPCFGTCEPVRWGRASIAEPSPPGRSRSGIGLWHRVSAGAGQAWDEVGYRLIRPWGEKMLVLPQAPRQLWEEKPGRACRDQGRRDPSWLWDLGISFLSLRAIFFLPASRDRSRLNK